jgi:hypothetical protein
MRMLTVEEQSVDFFNLAVPSPFFKETEPDFFSYEEEKNTKIEFQVTKITRSERNINCCRFWIVIT